MNIESNPTGPGPSDYLLFSLDQHNMGKIANYLGEASFVNKTTTAWPSNVMAGYKHYLSYEKHLDYWRSYMLSEWSKHITKDNDIYPADSRHYVDFFTYKEWTIHNLLNGTIKHHHLEIDRFWSNIGDYVTDEDRANLSQFIYMVTQIFPGELKGSYEHLLDGLDNLLNSGPLQDVMEGISVMLADL
jgi:hypothetical protein